MVKKIALLLTLFSLSITVLGQKINPSMQNPRSSLADADIASFSSFEMGFSIKLPKRVDGGGGSDGVENIWRLREGYYSAGVIERKVDVENSPDLEKITTEAADKVLAGFARWYFETKADILKVDKKTGVFEGHKGMEFRILLSDSVCLIRIFWIKNKGVKVGALLAGKQNDYESQALKVFDSLKLLTMDAVADRIRQKIEENTPAPLPQSPVVKRLTSDLVNANIKGKVKEIITDHEQLKEGKTESRQKYSEEYFNEEGDLVRSLEFSGSKELPQIIAAYGYIDGLRVSSSRVIVSEIGPPAAMAPPSPGNTNPPDKRYNKRFDYKYDSEGRLIETQEFDNKGSLRSKTVYSFAGNIRSVTKYWASNSVTDRSEQTLDDKGNPIGEITFDWPQKGSKGNSVYNYLEFDSHGNWIKRAKTFSRISPEKTESYWTRTEYRKITYF